jgi:large subunit ribosomal protein L30
MLPFNAIFLWINCSTDKTEDAMTKVKIKQVKSVIDRSKRQKDTVRALGLKKINQEVVHVATPQIMGMVDKVRHLVTVEEVK